MSSIMTSMSGVAVVPGMAILPLLQLASLDHLLGREVLRHEIFGYTRHAEFVSPTIHHRFARAKIIGGRRRSDAPFECGGAPGVAVRHLFTAKKTPKKIDEEQSLGKNGEERGDGDKDAKRRTRRDKCRQLAANVAAGWSPFAFFSPRPPLTLLSPRVFFFQLLLLLFSL